VAAATGTHDRFQERFRFEPAPANPADIAPSIAPPIIHGEEVLSCFEAVRDFVDFTGKRLIAVTVQGVPGKENGLHL
jgi:hypothetical protein